MHKHNKHTKDVTNQLQMEKNSRFKWCHKDILGCGESVPYLITMEPFSRR